MSPHLGPSARGKTSCLPLSEEEAEPLLGKSGGGGIIFNLGPPAVWSRGGVGAVGLPSSSFPRLAGKVSMETAASVSPEILGETGSEKSPSSFQRGGQHSSEERLGASGPRVLEEELVPPWGPGLSPSVPEVPSRASPLSASPSSPSKAQPSHSASHHLSSLHPVPSPSSWWGRALALFSLLLSIRPHTLWRHGAQPPAPSTLPPITALGEQETARGIVLGS